MGTFLQILGAIFLTFIILGVVAVVGGKFWLKRSLNKFVDQAQNTARRKTYDYDDIQSKTEGQKDIKEIDTQE